MHWGRGGLSTVISTASSTLSCQPGDSIETVDRRGQLSLIGAARAAGVEHFTLVSIPRNFVRQSPLTQAKAAVERALAESGMTYTILCCNFFIEIWLSPALGFDYTQRKAVLFGDGQSLITWVSYHDVAEFAIRSHLTSAAHNRVLDVGGPQDYRVAAFIRRANRNPIYTNVVHRGRLPQAIEHGHKNLTRGLVQPTPTRRLVLRALTKLRVSLRIRLARAYVNYTIKSTFAG